MHSKWLNDYRFQFRYGRVPGNISCSLQCKRFSNSPAGCSFTGRHSFHRDTMMCWNLPLSTKTTTITMTNTSQNEVGDSNDSEDDDDN